MKRNLQFLSMLLLMIVGGASFSWGKIVWPTAQIQYRTNKAIDNNPTDWNSKDFPKDGLTINKIEAGGTNFMWIIQEFLVPDMANVSEIKLAMAYNGTSKDVNVFLWSDTYPGVKAAYDATFVSNVSSTVSGSAFGTLTSSASTLTISGDDLTTLKTTFGSTGDVTVKFLLYIKNSSEATAFYGGTEALPSRRPHLEIVYTGVSPVKIGDTSYNTLSEAMTAASDNDVITLYDDVTLTARLEMNKSVTIKAAENCNVCIYRFHNTAGQSLIIGNTGSKTIVFDGSATGASFVIDDLGASKNNMYESNQNSTNTTLKSITFRNASSGTNQVISATSGNIKLDNVTFDSCNPATSIIYAKDGDDLTLLNAPTYTGCSSVPHIACGGRIKVLSPSTFSSAVIINVTTTLAANKLVVLGRNSEDSENEDIDNIITQFNVTNADLGLLKNTSTNHTHEIMLSQAYTLAVNSYGACTLVLPFTSTIPAGVSAYKINYTSGKNSVTANEIETALDANTPVLINAAEGNYKFVSNTIQSAVSGEGNPSVGALVGTYTDATPVAEGNYVLYANETSPIGFYKAGTGVTINANRAYLKSEGGSLARLAIVYGDETNAIEAVKAGIADNAIYTLSGVRVEQPTRGIYVKNGKKFIVK